MTEEQIRRYSRHIILPEVGGKGQKKLLASKILIFGLTGPGSTAALYLAASGVGGLGLADPIGSVLEAADLETSILFDQAGLGSERLALAGSALGDLNPGVTVETLPLGPRPWAELTSLASGYQAVLVSASGPEALEEAVKLSGASGRSVVVALASGFSGAVTVFSPGPGTGGPIPEEWRQAAPPAGVPLAPVASAVGSLAATEAVKLLLGIGQTLRGRLLLIDGELGDYREI